MSMRKQRLLVTILSGFFLLTTGWIDQGRCQQKYPMKPIDIIVPFAPGGSTDLSARTTASYVSKKYGIPVNLINMPGGRGIPATQDVLRADKDGYTLLADNCTTCSMLAAGVKDLPFKIMDRTFLGIMSSTSLTITVPVNSPFKTIQDLIAEAKKRPEKMSYSSLGGASVNDFGLRMLFKDTGVDISKMTVVMAQSGVALVTLAAGNNVSVSAGTTTASIPSVKSGFVRALLVTSRERDPDLPNVPSSGELGFTVVMSWNGISGPANLPPHIVAFWEKALKDAVNDPDVLAQIKKIGAVPYYHTSGAMREYVRKEVEQATKLF